MSAEQVNTFLIWTPPGKPLTIHLDYGVVERLNIEVMRGFGVTRRRGTEAGGLLIGKHDRGSEATIHIQEFEVVPCEYASGPSYILSNNDRRHFKEAIERWQPSLDRELYTVGYFRSHTRDGFALDDNDAMLFRESFRDPLDVALLIKPYATRVASAGFFLQEKGSLVTEGTRLEFPFTTAAKLGREQEALAEAPRVPAPAAPSAAVADPRPLRKPAIPSAYDRPMFTGYIRESSAWPRRLSWMAFAITLLAFGSVCGYEFGAGQLLKRSTLAVPAVLDFYSVRLQVSESEGSLAVRWDRDAGPVQAAIEGILTVTEGANSKEVKLGFAELRNGRAMYPHVGPLVRFRLELLLKDNRSFVETVEFKGQSPPAR